MIEEELLEVWISLTMLVRGNRVLNSLSYNEMVVLRLLKEQDGRTAEEIRSLMHLYKSQMNGVIKSLEKKGLIERKKDKTDRRKRMIYLKDNQLYKEEHEEIQRIMNDLVKGLGNKKAKQLKDLMEESQKILSRGNF